MSKKEANNSIKQVLTQLVLNVFEQNGNQQLNYKQVSAKLNILDPASKAVILEILKDEAFKQTLKEVAPGAFKLLELKTFIEGKVDLTTTRQKRIFL
jgi:ribonuclease R